MVEMSAFKMLVKNNLNKIDMNKTEYETKYNEINTLLKPAMEKIVKIFDEYYELGIKDSFQVNFNDNVYTIRYRCNDDDKYIIAEIAGYDLLLTSKYINNKIEYTDFANEDIKKCCFKYGLVNGLYENVPELKLFRFCTIIIENLDEIKRKFMNHLIVCSNNALNDSIENLNKIRKINNTLKEFTKDIIVVESDDGEKEVAAK